MSGSYNPTNWYWVVGDDQHRVYSSKHAGYVDNTDPEFVAWNVDNEPTQIPTEEELFEVLRAQYPAGAPWPVVRILPPLAFMRRVSIGRMAQITLAAFRAMLADPPDALPQTFLNMLNAAKEVDLDHADTQAGIGALAQAGIISEDEAVAFLANVTREELE